MDSTQIVEAEAASFLAPKIGEDEDIGNISDTITCSKFQSCSVNVDDDIVYEILSRLPVKSLMQLKCLSKHWCSMIRKDRYLIDLHLNQSKSRPRLLIAVPTDRKDYKRAEHDNVVFPIGYFLVTADLLFEGGEMSAVVSNIREMDTPSYRISGPLNSLICLFDPEKNHSVQVCNLSTREVTPWIKSTFISNLHVKDEDKYHLRSAKCDVGFDPVTKEHKVICFWNIYQHRVCEVMTVGEWTWRIIDDLPAYRFRDWWYFGAFVCVNGSIYYYNAEELPCISKDDKPKLMVAFDVGEEKFRVIGIPDFILDQIQHRYLHAETVQLIEIDGHPALLSRVRRDIAKIWLFDDVYKNGYRSNTWKEITIELPFYWEHDGGFCSDGHFVRFHSVIGTDFMFLYLYRCSAFGGGYHYATKVSQYSYNWKKKIFAEIKINGLPSSIPYLDYVSRVSAFAESLSPVK